MVSRRLQSVDTQILMAISVLESHQRQRRAHRAELYRIIAVRQREIDNLRAQLADSREGGNPESEN